MNLFPSPFILIHLISYASQVHNEQFVSYEGAQVWRTIFRGPNDILLIKKLIDNQDISIWSLCTNNADFLVQSDNKLKVNRLLRSQNLNHTVVILDVQRRVDAQRTDPVFWDENTLRIGHRLNWKEYPTLKIIDEYLNYLAENFASICKVIIIGYTAENRPIKMVKISNGNPNNKVVLITAGLHAREWISITSALYILDGIVALFDQLPQYMKDKEWIIIPLLNPDGYKYSHTHDRLWRKNRRQLKKCIGVDVNRNFKVDWDISGLTVNDECSDAYSGPYFFSEAESIALRDLILDSEKKPDALIDLHSYGQLILYPWSAKRGLIHNSDLHKLTAEQMTTAILNSTGQIYKFGVTYNTIYPATGTAIDWIYSSGVTQTFAIEAGNSNLHGFLSPPELIKSTGKEILAAVKQLAKNIDDDFLSRGRDIGHWF